MTQKQHDKHIADREARQSAKSELNAAPSTPDGLGAWEGGRAKLKSLTFGLKAKPSRTADAKNEPGIDYAKRKETQFETLSKGLDDVEEYLSNEPKTS